MKNLFIGGLLLLLISCSGNEDKEISGKCQAVEIFISGEKQLESCFAFNLFLLISSSKPEEPTMNLMKSCDEIKSNTESRLQELQKQKKIPENFLEAFFSYVRQTSLNPRIRIRREEAENMKKELCLNKTEIECKKTLAQSVIPLLQGKCLDSSEQGTEAQFTKCFIKEFLETGHQTIKTHYNCK